MASYQSIPAQLPQIQPPLNIDLMGKVLMAKEQQTNANIAQIDETLGQLKLQENMLIRDEDKQRFANSVQGLLDEVNKSGKLNLQSGDFTRRMKNHISTALDDYTLEQIGNSNKIRGFQLEVAERKKKGDGSYNDANYAYSAYKGGLQQYLNKETDQVGNLNYIPYTDLTEEHLKKLKTIKDLKGKRFVEVADGQGGIQRREIEGLTEDEIQSYFGSLMTSEELTQMKINGWARYGQNEEKAREYFTDYSTKKISNLESLLETAKVNAKSTTISPIKQQEAELEVKKLETEISNYKTNLNNKDKIAVDDIVLSLEKATYLAGLSNIASTEWNYSEKADDVYFKQKDLEIKYEDLAIKKAKEARENLEFSAKMQKEYGMNPDGTVATEGQTSVATSEDVLAEGESGIKNLQTLHNEYFNTIIDTTKSLLGKVDEDEKDTLIANLKKYGLDENLNKLPNFPKNASVASNAKKAFDESGLSKIYKDESDILTNAVIKKNSVTKDIVTVEKDSYYKKFLESPDKYLTAIIENTMENTADMNLKSEDLKKLKDSGDKIKTLYQKATGKELNIQVDAFGQASPIGKTWYQVKQELKKAITDKPILVNDLADITEYTGKQSLKEDSKAIVEATLADRAKKRALSTMTVYDDINLTNANTRDKLIQMMPQSRIEGSLFKKDLPMTIKRKGENLEIIQYQGQENIPGSKGEKRTVSSRIIVDKGDISLFNEIAKYVDYEESKRISYSADTYKSFDESKPQVNNNKDKKDTNYETKNAVAVAKSIKSNPEIARPFIVSGNPQTWSTAPLIEKNMEGFLTSIIGQQQASIFTDEYMKNINAFKLKPVSTMSPILGVKTWSLEVYNPYGKRLDIKDLGVQNLDKDTKYLIDHHPEVYISEFLAQNIKEDPKFINAVFKE